MFSAGSVNRSGCGSSKIGISTEIYWDTIFVTAMLILSLLLPLGHSQSLPDASLSGRMVEIHITSRLLLERLKLSIVIACGSGFQLTYSFLCALSQSANRSIEGNPAAVFCTPGKYMAVIVILGDKQ